MTKMGNLLYLSPSYSASPLHICQLYTLASLFLSFTYGSLDLLDAPRSSLILFAVHLLSFTATQSSQGESLSQSQTHSE